METQEEREVDNLPEMERLLEEMIRVIPVLLRPIVMDPMPHLLIRETSLEVASAIGVEKRRTSTIDDIWLSISVFRSVIRLRSHLIGLRSQRNLELIPSPGIQRTHNTSYMMSRLSWTTSAIPW